MSFATLIRREPRALSFGLLHTLAATIGQTFVISLFLPGIKESFGVGDAAVSLLFTGTTLASALALWKIGAWIDRTDIVRYCMACGIFLSFSCLLIATAFQFVVLVLGLFCLRLAGNGLLTHVALTATARYFTSDRGQALSLVLLGSSLGEAMLPGVLVALISVSNWRVTLALAGALGFLLVMMAALAVRRHPLFRTHEMRSAPAGTASLQQARPRTGAGESRYFLLTVPLFLSMPMAVTATIFHQALIAEAKAVSLQWFAVSFIAFAMARVVTSVATGPAVDRLGSAWLFCLHLLPLAAGIAALAALQSPWIVPFFWFAAGVASGVGTIVQTTVVAERVALSHLGRARSMLAAGTIVASAIGPSLYGLALAAGAGMPALLWATVAALMAATALGVLATKAEGAGELRKTTLLEDCTPRR